MKNWRPEQGINKWIVVNQGDFTLTLLKRPRLRARFYKLRRYKVAVGTAEFPTPNGYFMVTKKAKNPDWMMPKSEWIPREDWGKIIPGGDPANPLIARWISITDVGVGIHGTAALDSLGTRASHGCIRMAPDDVVELFGMVPEGTPVLVE